MRRRASGLAGLCHIFLYLLCFWCFDFVQFADAQDSMSLPPGEVGTAYSAQVKAEGGLPPLAWRLASGELPPGLGVSATGRIEGKPTAAKRDAYAFALSVSDSSQPAQSATMRFSIVIKAAPLRIASVSQEPAALKIVGANAEVEPAMNTAAVAEIGGASSGKQGTATHEVPFASGANENAPSGAGAAGGSEQAAAPAQTVDPCETTSVAYFPEPPIAGRKVLSGCAGKGPGARVVVYTKNSVDKCPASFPDLVKPWPGGVIDNRPANVDPKTGIFHAELTSPITGNELICPYSVSADQNPPVVATKWGYEEADSPGGRTRYYLSTGVELAEDNQQFSNQDVYLGFALDRNWIRGTSDSWLTKLFNSEFSAQLTSIPVAASSTTTISSTTTTTPSVTTFISSRKAAVVGGALYAPLYFKAFKGWFGSQTSAFFAPIVKGGLQTITSGALSASAPAPGTNTTTTTVNNAGLYYFWGGGIRLGDLKLHRSWNIAPEILSHIDLTVGQWQNFKQCLHASSCTPSADGTVPSNQLYQPLLFALEGQFNVPKTPVVIGFKSVTPLNGGGQGDLRFFFGVKLDVGCIYKSFKGGTTPKFLDCTDDQPASKSTNGATQSPSGEGVNASGASTNSGSPKKQ
jgi:hypothetical protein